MTDLIPSRTGIFLLTTISIPALGPNQHAIQWVVGGLFLWSWNVWSIKLTTYTVSQSYST